MQSGCWSRKWLTWLACNGAAAELGAATLSGSRRCASSGRFSYAMALLLLHLYSLSLKVTQLMYSTLMLCKHLQHALLLR